MGGKIENQESWEIPSHVENTDQKTVITITLLNSNDREYGIEASAVIFDKGVLSDTMNCRREFRHGGPISKNLAESYYKQIVKAMDLHDLSLKLFSVMSYRSDSSPRALKKWVRKLIA